MKVYLIQYNNGEVYEDYYDWISEKVYSSQEKCETVLIAEGYSKTERKWPGQVRSYWTQTKSKECSEYSAEIVEMEVD